MKNHPHYKKSENEPPTELLEQVRECSVDSTLPKTEKTHPKMDSTTSPALRLVFWETTAGCNLECVHCRRLDVSRELMKNDLNTEQSFKLIDQICAVGQPIFILSGGEPLIRPDIFDIAKYAGNKGLPVALATNGTLISNDIAEKIVETGIRRVSISIDGADATTHDKFRKQEGSLEKALDGFRRLKKLGMSMQINCTITRHNAHQMDELYQMALHEGADALHLFMLVPVGCGVQIAESNMLSSDKYEEILNWAYDRSKEGKIQIKPTCAPHYFRIVRQREKAAPLHTVSKGHPGGAMHTLTKGCLAGSAVCFISHQGEVFPCGYLPVSAGNIQQTDLVDIWNGAPVFQSLRDISLLEGKCGACEFSRICMGCRARAYYEHGNYMAEEPYCDYQPLKSRHKNQ